MMGPAVALFLASTILRWDAWCVPVVAPCIWCKRAPIEGETYGPCEKEWDHTGICPECWDRAFKLVEGE